ncbi:MAG: tripartite tricarboxylate transporter substrate-binding protein, partial [Burkholderiaceae bacterium]
MGAPALHLRAHRGDSFPQRTIMLWVPWPAGGATDLTMRLLAELAGRHLGQKVAIDNRPGAGGTLAMPILQQSAPDDPPVERVGGERHRGGSGEGDDHRPGEVGAVART